MIRYELTVVMKMLCEWNRHISETHVSQVVTKYCFFFVCLFSVQPGIHLVFDFEHSASFCTIEGV